MRRIVLALALVAGCSSPAPSAPSSPTSSATGHEPTAGPAPSNAPGGSSATASATTIWAPPGVVPPSAISSASPASSATDPALSSKQGAVCSIDAFASDKCADKNGVFQVQGYVVYAQRCGTCPPHADCKPCNAYVVLSTTKSVKDKDAVGPAQIRVMVSSSSTFKEGDQITLKVRRGGTLITLAE